MYAAVTRFFLSSALALAALLPTAAADYSAGGNTPAQAPRNPHLWRPATKSVSVFKNGLAFFVQEGAASLHQGWCHASSVPPAAFGTFAIYSTDPDHTVDLVGVGPGELIDFRENEHLSDAGARRDRLAAYVGLEMQVLHRAAATESQTTGRLVEVSQDHLLLSAADQTVAIRLADVATVQLVNLPLRVHLTGEDEPPARANLAMAYLRSGLVWIPEYALKLIDDQTAELTLRGTLVNEAEDLVDCDVNFIVGVPHFIHSDLLSPMALGQTLRGLGSALPHVGIPQQLMNQVMNRAAVAQDRDTTRGTGHRGEGTDDLAELLSSLPALESTAASDFTVYTRKNLTIRRGERAMVTLMTTTVPYQHRYRWDNNQPIQHLVVLENNSTGAWTTGACLTTAGRQPLSEDLLKYTPAGGQAEVRVASAINLSHDLKEIEADRRFKAHEPGPSQFFDLVAIDGTIQLKNYEQRAVEIVISVPVSGRPTKASDGGTIRTDVQRLRLLERSGTISWTLTLQPGQEQKLTYSYERYVPSN